MAVNVSQAPCPRAFSRKFRANSSKPQRVLSPTPAKRGATNPIRNILTPRRNSPAGCAARQHHHARAASRPAERVLLRNLASAARLAQAILSSASVSATPPTARARSSVLKAMATSANLPSASPTTEQKNSWKDTRISAGPESLSIFQVESLCAHRHVSESTRSCGDSLYKVQFPRSSIEHHSGMVPSGFRAVPRQEYRQTNLRRGRA